MFHMKKQWGRLNRVRIGPWKWEPGGPTAKEVKEWIEANCTGHYFHSDGHECFYFDNYQSAIFFKMRWTDQLTK